MFSYLLEALLLPTLLAEQSLVLRSTLVIPGAGELVVETDLDLEVRGVEFEVALLG